MKLRIKFLVFLLLAISIVLAQKKPLIQIVDNKQKKEVIITINNHPFTSFLYNDTLYKPILYPVFSPDGQIITRGYPLVPREGKPIDHPHHQGIWFNYENVNGLDFWNNSFAITADKKANYGAIKNVKIQSIKNNQLVYTANWVNANNKTLLQETTTFVFVAVNHLYTIDRITTLTATEDVAFNDAKDGLLGMRVAKELQIPSVETKTYTDINGIVTTVNAVKDSTINGTYLTAQNKKGDSAWGTRANWCLLYGKKNSEVISIAIIDHPKNVGYPTYWHARGYGLFAANPLGQKIFSNGNEKLDFHLSKGSSVTFKFRIVIGSGTERLSADVINGLAQKFAEQ
jgi:hypothetical protein